MLPVILAILGFAFVVIIHELGHFVFAKWAGVKVLRFSLGFPPVVWEKQVGETTYAIGLIWAGGYVKMLGEEDVEGKTDPRSMLNVRPGWRALILLGGVLFNLVSSWLLLVALAWYGMPITPPVVAGITPDMADPTNTEHRLPSPAVRLGLQLNDEIRSVNGVRTRSFEDAVSAVALAGGKALTMVVRRNGQDLTLGEGQDIKPVKMGGSRGLPSIGVEGPAGFRLEAIADAVGEPPAALAGTGWVLTVVDGKPVAGRLGQQVQRELEPRVGQDITFVFTRGLETLQSTLRYGGTSLPFDIAIGLPVRVKSAPIPGMPAALAGIQAGDVVAAVDGQIVSGLGHFNALVQTAAVAGRAMHLDVRRGAETLAIEVTASPSVDGRLRLGLPIGALTEGWLPLIPTRVDGGLGGLAHAGLKPGDALLAVHLDKIDKQKRVVPAVVVHGGQPVMLALSGDPTTATKQKLRRVLVSQRVLTVDATAVKLADVDGKAGAPLAIADLPAEVAAVIPQLQVGDWLVRIDAHGTGQALEVIRGAGPAERVELAIGDGGVAFEFQREIRTYQLEYPSEPLAIANHAAWRMVVDTLSIIPKFFKPSSPEGLDATKTLSGPVGIFSLMKDQFERDGFAAWLRIVALIGLNLFLVNLLPIPLVDGGQLVQLGVEVAMGRPLPDRVKAVINNIGFAMVISLMLFVLSLDILRKLGWI